MSRMAEYAMEQENLSGAFDEDEYNNWLNDPVAQKEYQRYLNNTPPASRIDANHDQKGR